MVEPVFAALDLGTHNCRLLIAQAVTGGFRILDSFSRPVRLGEGLGHEPVLGPAAIERTLAALHVCAEKIARHRVAASRAVATEACRRARNRADFIEAVARHTALNLEVIPATEEARLALQACAPLLDPARPRALLFDIGGGSTELVWLAVAPGTTPAVLDQISLPAGVVDLSERHGGGRGGAAAFQAMAEEIAGPAATFDRRNGIGEAVAAGKVQIIGNSGTVTTLAALHLGLDRYDRARVDGAVVPTAALLALARTLSGLDMAARAACPCIGRDRADLVVAGCAVLETLLTLWPVDRLTVADRGLREGILVDLARRGGTAAPTLAEQAA